MYPEVTTNLGKDMKLKITPHSRSYSTSGITQSVNKDTGKKTFTYSKSIGKNYYIQSSGGKMRLRYHYSSRSRPKKRYFCSKCQRK